MVYVDRLRCHGWKLGDNCHLIADTLEELHKFAGEIGLKREWFQNKPSSIPHYDLTVNKRRLALAHGAKELSDLEMSLKVKNFRIYGKPSYV